MADKKIRGENAEVAKSKPAAAPARGIVSRVRRIEKFFYVVIAVAGTLGISGAWFYDQLKTKQEVLRKELESMTAEVARMKSNLSGLAEAEVKAQAGKLLSDFWIVDTKASTQSGEIPVVVEQARFCALSHTRVLAGPDSTEPSTGGGCDLAYRPETRSWVLSALTEGRGSGTCAMACFGKVGQ